MRIFILGLLGASLALSVSAVYAAAALLLIVFLLRFREWKTSPFDIPVLLYVAWGVFVTLLSGSAPLRKALSAHSALLLFLLFVHFSKKEDFRPLITWFLIGSVATAVWGVLQLLSGINHIPGLHTTRIPEFWTDWPEWLVSELAVRDGRPTGPRSHPLTYTECFIPVYFLSVGVLFQFVRQRKWSGWDVHRWTIAAVAAGIGMLIAQGRAVWMGVFAGTFFLFPILTKKDRWIAGAGIFACVVLIVAASPTVRSRVMSSFSSKAGTSADQFSKSTRLELWEKVPELVREDPVAGKGIKGVEIMLPWEPGGIMRPWAELHNIFLQHLVERGIVGLGLLIWILILLIRMMTGLPPPMRWIALGGFAAFMAAGMTESWMKDKEVAFVFWTMAGCLARMRR